MTVALALDVTVTVTVTVALLLTGCATAREKDCKELLPLVDAAHAEPSDENVAKLKSFYAQEKELVDAVTAYTRAVERTNAGRKAVKELGAAMKMKGDAGAFRLEMFDASRPHAERLLRLCMAPTPPPPPECAALSHALEACITPAKDDTTAEEQLLSCSSGFAAVRAADPSTNESIQALATTLRDFEPYARNIGAPAKTVINTAKTLLPKITDAQKAAPEATQAELHLRALCPASPSHH